MNKGLDCIVSICCITYNHENYIEQCLDGFLMQETNFEFEVLIHDDASTDSTADIIRAYEKKHSHIIKPIYQTENQYSKGISISATYNFPRAKGKYIAMCEGDDYWTDPLKLQKQVDFMEGNNDIILTFHAYLKLKNNFYEKSFKSNFFKNKSIIPNKVFIKNGGSHRFATASIMFQRKMINPLPNYFYNCPVGDLPLALLAISKGEIGYLEDEMCVYRVQALNSWSKARAIDNNLYEHLDIYNKLQKTLELFNTETNYEFSEYVSQIISYKTYMLLQMAIKNNIKSKDVWNLKGKLIFNDRIKLIKSKLINMLIDSKLVKWN